MAIARRAAETLRASSRWEVLAACRALRGFSRHRAIDYRAWIYAHSMPAGSGSNPAPESGIQARIYRVRIILADGSVRRAATVQKEPRQTVARGDECFWPAE